MEAPKISRGMGKAMILFAFVIDAIQFALTLIPFVGWVFALIVGFLAAMIFGIWCSHLGISLMDSKRSFGFLGTILGELVPFINGMWWWTVFISYTVITERRGKTDI
jgi:hypothetical protein